MKKQVFRIEFRVSETLADGSPGRSLSFESDAITPEGLSTYFDTAKALIENAFPLEEGAYVVSVRSLNDAKRVEAIKAVRSMTNASLKDAIKIIDGFEPVGWTSQSSVATNACRLLEAAGALCVCETVPYNVALTHRALTLAHV